MNYQCDGMSEKDFQARTVELMRLCDFFVYHTYDSRRSEEGYPDITAIHRTKPICLIAELKSETGKLTRGYTDSRGRYHPGQADWMQRWHEIATDPRARIYTRLWRPSDTQEIEKFLTER